jgi:hypothetical protein
MMASGVHTERSRAPGVCAAARAELLTPDSRRARWRRGLRPSRGLAPSPRPASPRRRDRRRGPAPKPLRHWHCPHAAAAGPPAGGPRADFASVGIGLGPPISGKSGPAHLRESALGGSGLRNGTAKPLPWWAPAGAPNDTRYQALPSLTVQCNLAPSLVQTCRSLCKQKCQSLPPMLVSYSWDQKKSRTRHSKRTLLTRYRSALMRSTFSLSRALLRARARAVPIARTRARVHIPPKPKAGPGRNIKLRG